jgi:hypothetical protein
VPADAAAQSLATLQSRHTLTATTHTHLYSRRCLSSSASAVARQSSAPAAAAAAAGGTAAGAMPAARLSLPDIASSCPLPECCCEAACWPARGEPAALALAALWMVDSVPLGELCGKCTDSTFVCCTGPEPGICSCCGSPAWAGACCPATCGCWRCPCSCSFSCWYSRLRACGEGGAYQRALTTSPPYDSQHTSHRHAHARPPEVLVAGVVPYAFARSKIEVVDLAGRRLAAGVRRPRRNTGLHAVSVAHATQRRRRAATGVSRMLCCH